MVLSLKGSVLVQEGQRIIVEGDLQADYFYATWSSICPACISDILLYRTFV